MPSPFPGMDPYLEGALWTTVHFSLSAEIVSSKRRNCVPATWCSLLSVLSQRHPRALPSAPQISILTSAWLRPAPLQ